MVMVMVIVMVMVTVIAMMIIIILVMMMHGQDQRPQSPRKVFPASCSTRCCAGRCSERNGFSFNFPSHIIFCRSFSLLAANSHGRKKMFLNLFFYLGPMPVQFSMKKSEQAHPSGQAKPHLWCRASSPSTERATRDSKYAKQTIDP
jgi:hypothetical protein